MDWTTVYLFLSTHSVPIWNAVAAEAAQPVYRKMAELASCLLPHILEEGASVHVVHAEPTFTLSSIVTTTQYICKKYCNIPRFLLLFPLCRLRVQFMSSLFLLPLFHGCLPACQPIPACLPAWDGMGASILARRQHTLATDHNEIKTSQYLQTTQMPNL
jgi:hypothetical protein